LEIKPDVKALYHAAAVLVSNYSVTLFAAGAELFERSLRTKTGGRQRARGDRALLPLLDGTLANLEELGLPYALTGPIARGDVGVVEGHVRAFRRRARGFLPLYYMLGRRTIALGRAKNTLSRKHAAQLRRLLKTVS